MLILKDILFLKEGIFEDIIERYPDLKNSLTLAKNKNVYPKYFNWIAKQLRHTNEPIKDIIPVLLSFQTEENQQKLKSVGSHTDINQYKTVAELSYKLEDLSRNKGSYDDQNSDIIFNIPDNPWLIAMPSTTKSSCELGKGTSWCVSRTKSQNLFLSYVARPDKNIILFFIINKNINPRSNPEAKISIGFIDGEPRFSNEHGGVTVDASNNGITEDAFSKIVGSENAINFLEIMKAKSVEIGNKHPAKLELEILALDEELYQEKRLTFKNADDQEDFENTIAEIRNSIASSSNSSPQKLLLLAKQPSWTGKISYMHWHIANNPNITDEIAELLIEQDNPSLIYQLLVNSNISEYILDKLSYSEYTTIRLGVVKNIYSTTKIIDKLAFDKLESIRRIAAQSNKISSKILDTLTDDEDWLVRLHIANNPNVSTATLEKLSMDEEETIRALANAKKNKIVNESILQLFEIIF